MYKTYSEEVITVDVYNLCRICMLNHKNLAYFNIFGKCMPNNGPSLAAVLEQLTSIKFCENDGLPARICSSCESRVIDAFMLKIQTERTDKRLLELIKPDNSESKSLNLSGKSFGTSDDELTGKTILKQVDKSSYIINYESDEIALVEVEVDNTDLDNDNIKYQTESNDKNDGKIVITKCENDYYRDNDHTEIIYLDNPEIDSDENDTNDSKIIEIDGYNELNLQDVKINTFNQENCSSIATSSKQEDLKSKLKKIGSLINYDSAKQTNSSLIIHNKNILNKQQSPAKSESLNKPNQSETVYFDDEDGDQSYYIERNDLIPESDNSDSEQNISNENETYMVVDSNDDDNGDGGEVNVESTYILPIDIENQIKPTNKIMKSEKIKLEDNQETTRKLSSQSKKKRTTTKKGETTKKDQTTIKRKRSVKSQNYEDRKHECNVCLKKFTGRSNLVEHLRLHANIKMFKCRHCDKSFVQSGNLSVHERIHTKERPFQCHLCPKNYNQSSALKIHFRTHTNERNYPCLQCPKRFTNGTDLSKHIRIHDDNLKTPCPHCNQLFSQKYNLYKHIQKIHCTDKTNRKPKSVNTK